ncbi:hypothetical protein Val02_32590 [Virgisporangium aliadipatigenens]|uniref:Uncharacterized protein n=1 Tax=Virgisporangium aliadipatigenens TaxID=741659 RepID=A0A8J3YMC2_9ACTN|nr:hypothetical protein [Virgisporangium aliadipatigenens]GIJ46373.1 hypothetical protein Val02_32590 [Virgisporangium aliadipatigenens]
MLADLLPLFIAIVAVVAMILVVLAVRRRPGRVGIKIFGSRVDLDGPGIVPRPRRNLLMRRNGLRNSEVRTTSGATVELTSNEFVDSVVRVENDTDAGGPGREDRRP